MSLSMIPQGQEEMHGLQMRSLIVIWTGTIARAMN